MDTRQLAAFCAVVERRSFSQAAERLGVTQPAVSLQIRALEKRFGTQLLDRSGRRVEPTEAGMRLYRGAQRLLALEEQVVAEVAEDGGDKLAGSFEIGASTGPGGIVLSHLLCEFQGGHPELHVVLWVFDTQTIVERVAARELELGVVGAARRHRGVVFEPFFQDEVILACPPGHPFAGKTVTLDALGGAGLIVMQEGAGVRQLIEDELRRVGTRLRDLDVQIELGLQESVTSAVRGGYGVTFISRASVESDLAAGTLAEARVDGLELQREIFLVRASGRAGDAIGTRLRRVCPRTAAVIVRWSLAELADVLSELGVERSFLVSSPRWAHIVEIPTAGRWPEIPSDRIEVPSAADALLVLGGGSAIDTAKAASAVTGLPLVSVPTTYSGAEWTGFYGVRSPERRIVGGGSGANLAGIVYDVGLTFGLPRAETVGTALNALSHCAEALYGRRTGRSDECALAGAELIARWLPRVAETPLDVEARVGLLRGRPPRARRSGSPGLRLHTRSRKPSAAATACRTAR